MVQGGGDLGNKPDGGPRPGAGGCSLPCVTTAAAGLSCPYRSSPCRVANARVSHHRHRNQRTLAGR
jgi:hypothetical protein